MPFAVEAQSPNHWTTRESFRVTFLKQDKGLWIKTGERTSLVAQWIRIHPPRQETQVQSLVWGDATCHGTTKPAHHSYRAHTLEPLSHSY